jgi:hypothetical protein
MHGASFAMSVEVMTRGAAGMGTPPVSGSGIGRTLAHPTAMSSPSAARDQCLMERQFLTMDPVIRRLCQSRERLSRHNIAFKVRCIMGEASAPTRGAV